MLRWIGVDHRVRFYGADGQLTGYGADPGDFSGNTALMDTPAASAQFTTRADTHFYRQARPSEFDPDVIAELQRAALVCCEQLKIFDCEVIPVVACSRAESLAGWPGSLKGFSLLTSPQCVYVVFNEGHSMRSLITTTGHECAHQFLGTMHNNGDDNPHNEEFCDIIGHNLANHLGY